MSRAGRRTGSRSSRVMRPLPGECSGYADHGPAGVRLSRRALPLTTSADREPLGQTRNGGEDMKRLAAAALAVMSVTLFAFGVRAAELTWARSWGASPQAPNAALGPAFASPTFGDATLRQVV